MFPFRDHNPSETMPYLSVWVSILRFLCNEPGGMPLPWWNFALIASLIMQRHPALTLARLPLIITRPPLNR